MWPLKVGDRLIKGTVITGLNVYFVLRLQNYKRVHTSVA